MSMTLLSDTKVHGGQLQRYEHHSSVCNASMIFAIFMPSSASQNTPVPTLYWLSGLTCNDENFSQKSGAFGLAETLGMAVVMPDTSPRDMGIAGENDSYDIGSGAGFYVNSTQTPWQSHYQMFDYVNKELPALIESHFYVTAIKSIGGHSMGGHGALISALKQPGLYASVSAMAPIASPSNCPWGEKIFTAYMGEDRSVWAQWDANQLVQANTAVGIAPQALFICQGDADPFYSDQLKPELFNKTCAKLDYPLIYKERSGYDHGYYYIATFIAEHIHYHAEYLTKK